MANAYTFKEAMIHLSDLEKYLISLWGRRSGALKVSIKDVEYLLMTQDAYQYAASTMNSTFNTSLASLAWPQALAGARPAGTHSFQTSFNP